MFFRSLVALSLFAANVDASGAFDLSPKTPVHVPGTSRVHHTAIREFAGAFEGASAETLAVIHDDVAPAGCVFLAVLSESERARALALRGIINLHNVPVTNDAFEILVHEDALLLLGNTPRGLLQAVYEIQEVVRARETVEATFHRCGTFQIRQRFFHQRFDEWPGEPADIRYISHLGASHCLLSHDWQGDRRHLQGFVTSPIFPKAINPEEVEKNGRQLRQMIDVCLDYGLEPALWITELPCQGGPWVPEDSRREFLTRFPDDVLSDCGTYQGKVMCFGHPQVQEFYRDLLARFFKDFPEVSVLFLFGLDSGGELCDPEGCSRCKGISKFEQRDRLLRFLIEEGGKVRPGLRVLTTGWGWSGDTEQFLARQRELPAASGLFLAAETDGWQAERQIHDLLVNARSICAERGQVFLGYDDFHWGDDSVHTMNDIQDYPFGIGAKIRRWRLLDADGVFDHWGGVNQDISCNSIACREFFMNPLADARVVCSEIAKRQFGETAGAHAFNAWQELEQAHAVLSNACTWPPSQWPGWYQGRDYVPTAEEFAKHGLKGGEPPRQSSGIVYNPPVLAERLQRVGDAWRAAYPHYEGAARHMRAAIDTADGGELFYAFWWSGEKKTPTRREHLRRELAYIESMGTVGREIGIHFELNALFERVGGNSGAYRRQAVDLLREDAAACRAAADYFDHAKTNGDDRHSDRGWQRLYRAKAEGIDEYLRAEP